MAETTSETDLGLGLGLALGLVAVLAAAVMYIGHANHTLTGAAFGVAILAGTLGIAALHVYGS